MSQPNRLIPSDFTPAPSFGTAAGIVHPVTAYSNQLGAVAVPVGTDGDVAPSLGLGREALAAAGFDGKPGQTLVLPQPAGPALVAVGIGAAGDLTLAVIRDFAAAFTRAAHLHASIGLALPEWPDAASAAAAVTEGAILARYRYTALKTETKHVALASVELLTDADVAAGIRRGEAFAQAAMLARDLTNTPPGHLTATAIGDLAAAIGPEVGLTVEVFDKAALIELGTGGLLGVNSGSTEEPRMVKLTYRPSGTPTGRLAFVGKGITYDSGGISLKPSDPMHALMKMDMAGAGAVLAAMSVLQAVDCPTEVTGYLMCTDNMPSGSAIALGDVLTIRGGTTVEVRNTDAEGRLVMSDALVLAAEQKPDAIVDIATLTGSALMTLGMATAAVFSNNDALLAQLKEAAALTDEPIWQLPLEKKYRKQLDSDIADIANLAGPYAGATTAALFLVEFVNGLPWGHLDIAGTMQSDADESWRSKGATGFGARLLVELAIDFLPPAP